MNPSENNSQPQTDSPVADPNSSAANIDSNQTLTNPISTDTTPPETTSQTNSLNNSPSRTGVVTPPLVSNNSRPKSKKKLLIPIAGGLAVLLLVGGAVFGWYLPNRPENVWNTGLNRSGQAVDKLVTKLSEEKELKKYQNTELTAKVDVKSKDVNVQGSLGTKLSKNKADGSLDINVKMGDTPEKKLALQFLTELPDGKRFPNTYFKLTGLSTLGLDSLIGSTKAYDGKWIAVTSEYLESIAGTEEVNKPKKRENVSSEEVTDLIRTVSATSNEYLFTDDKDKAVLERKQFSGKEILEGMRVYRYKVGINKPHAKQYCKVLSERVLDKAAYKKLLSLDDNAVAEQKKSAAKSCNEDLDRSLKDNETFDMWIDAKYKLIHKVRIYDEKEVTTYTDFGQIYKGGDQLNFFVAYHNEKDKSDAKFSVRSDTKTSVSSGEFTWKQTSEDAIDAKVTFEAKPFSGEVKIEKPTGTISIEELLKTFGLDPTPPAPRPTASPAIES